MFVRSVTVVAAQLAHLLQCVVALHLSLATRDISFVAVAHIEQYYSVWQYICITITFCYLLQAKESY